jgi:transcriptional regulator with XRE-family HTH domain
MAIDMAELARWVRRDRARLKLTQAAYAKRLGGLTQGQISNLERGAFRELSLAVAHAMRRRFKRLPRKTARAETDALIALVSDHLARKFSEIMHILPEHERRELADHLMRQITLLTEPHLRPRRRPPPRRDPPILFGDNSRSAPSHASDDLTSVLAGDADGE